MNLFDQHDAQDQKFLLRGLWKGDPKKAEILPVKVIRYFAGGGAYVDFSDEDCIIISRPPIKAYPVNRSMLFDTYEEANLVLSKHFEI